MKHLVFIDAKAPKSVIDGVRMHKSNSRVQTYFYDEVADIPGLLSMLGNSKSHLTMYFQTVIDGEILDLRSLFRNVPAQGKLFGSMTVSLDDRRGMGKIGPRSLGYLDLMEHHHGTNFLTDTFKHLKRKGHDNRRRILLRSVRPFRWLYNGARTDHCIFDVEHTRILVLSASSPFASHDDEPNNPAFGGRCV